MKRNDSDKRVDTLLRQLGFVGKVEVLWGVVGLRGFQLPIVQHT